MRPCQSSTRFKTKHKLFFPLAGDIRSAGEYAPRLSQELAAYKAKKAAAATKVQKAKEEAVRAAEWAMEMDYVAEAAAAKATAAQEAEVAATASSAALRAVVVARLASGNEG